MSFILFFFFFQAEDGIRDSSVTGVQTCALPISTASVLSQFRPLSRPPADVIRFIQIPSIRAPLGPRDRTDGSCGSAGWRSDCAKCLWRNLLPIRQCAAGPSRTKTFFQTPFDNSAVTVFHAWRTCSCEGMAACDLSGLETKATSNSG